MQGASPPPAGDDSPLVRIEDVEILPGDGPPVEVEIKAPRPGDGFDRYAFELDLAPSAGGPPLNVVRARCIDKTLLELVPAERGGRLRGAIGAYLLPPRFELDLEAELAGGERRRLATIEGSRRALAPRPGAGGLGAAIVVSPTGRVGSTMAVGLLGRHPELIAPPHVSAEPRLATYWLGITSTLARPASFVQALRAPTGPRWWLGDDEGADRDPRITRDVPGFRYLGREGVERLAAIAREEVEAYYGALATEHGKRPRAFVEKSPPGRLERELLVDLFPRYRELVLVRDPRDVACSILAYRRRFPDARLVGGDPRTEEGTLRAVGAAIRGTLAELEEPGGRGLPVRYEDLVLDPVPALTQVAAHLGIGAEPGTLERMAEATAAEGERIGRHVTSGSPEQSVGRWRRDLSADGRRLAEAELGDLIERLGYA